LCGDREQGNPPKTPRRFGDVSTGGTGTACTLRFPPDIVESHLA
jgi:hypothetical protein